MTGDEWPGCWLPGGVLYEVEVAAFTAAGTFDAATDRLDHLVDLGVDAVQVRHPGRGLARFVAACHARRLGVVVGLGGGYADVDGRLPRAAQARLLDRAGELLDGAGVDGLCVRAPRAVADSRTADVVAGLADGMRATAGRTRRPLALVVDAALTDPRRPAAAAGGYLAGPHERPTFGGLQRPTNVLRDVFSGTGRWPASSGGPTPGGPCSFVVYLRDLERATPSIGHLHAAGLPLRLARLAATLLLAGPFTAALRMGEEWAAGQSPLDWSALREPAHRELYDYHRRLLAVCRTHPTLRDATLGNVVTGLGDRYVTLRRDNLMVVANLAPTRRRISVPPWPRDVLIASRLGVTLNADSVELPAECAAVIDYR